MLKNKMKVLVTGSAGHLGEALMRVAPQEGWDAVGLDLKTSQYTNFVGSIVDRDFVHDCVAGVDVIFHTATLHKPHVGTHTRKEFIDINISGTLNLLEEAVVQRCQALIYTSTTSTFGAALRPPGGAPAVWVTESLQPQPKNIYGVTKCAAEDLCALFHRKAKLPCIVLKTSRFFPEADDDKSKRDAFDDENLKVNELLFRRVDIADLVTAHIQAAKRAETIGFDKFILSATTPFRRADAGILAVDAPSVLEHYMPEYAQLYTKLGWSMFKEIDRVYDNTHAREVLGWSPKYSFERALENVKKGFDYRSELARKIGSKGYHDIEFGDEPYPVDGF